MRTDGSKLEEYVRFVYETLLSLKGEQIVVTRGATLRGKSGSNYNVDVFYEFLQAGIRHRVVFECKDHVDPVKRDDVLAFDGKIKDISQVIGVMVSRSGYQSGAREYGEHQGILLLTADDLPTIGMLLASRLELATMPDEACVGEPFWTLYEIQENGRLTGEPIVWFADEQKVIPLFISKRDAEISLSKLKVESIYQDYPYELVVRGLPQRVLRSLCVMANKRASFVLNYAIPYDMHEIWHCRVMSVEEVKTEFLMSQWQNF